MARPRRRARRNLPAGGLEQIGSANHVGDALQVIVYGHGELIGPVAQPIAKQQIAALLARILLLRADERSTNRSTPGSMRTRQPTSSTERNPSIAACARIALTVDRRTRTAAQP